MSCNLCGADNYAVLFEAGVAQAARIVRCRQCGLMYANPRADEPDHVLIERFDVDYEINNIDTERYRKESLQVRDDNDTRHWVGSLCPARGRSLEAGSGFGYLLDHFRKDGWTVTGVEPNAGLCHHAKNALKLDVMSMILPEAKFPDASFDVVLMMHVIEHVPDPLDTLREIRRVLRPNGMLVLETPRYDTLMFKLLGRRERSLSCGGHIYFFTSRTLRLLAEKAGLQVARSDKVGRSLTLGRLSYNLGVMSRSPALRDAIVGLTDKLGLTDASITINVRDMERMYLANPGRAF